MSVDVDSNKAGNFACVTPWLSVSPVVDLLFIISVSKIESFHYPNVGFLIEIPDDATHLRVYPIRLLGCFICHLT